MSKSKHTEAQMIAALDIAVLITVRQRSLRAKQAMETTRAMLAWKSPSAFPHFPAASAAAG